MIRFFVDNPVLLKELRIGMREKRVLVILTGYLAVLTFVAIMMLADGLDYIEATRLPQLGTQYFGVLFWMQLVGVLLVTPGLTSGSLSAERERQSLDMILSSRLTVAEVVLGKLGFALGFMGLVMVSTLPLLAVVFFLGGISPSRFAMAYVELFVTALLSAQVGLVFSSRETRTTYANSHSYGVVFLSLFTVVPFYAAMREDGSAQFWAWVLFGSTLLYCVLFLFVKSLNNIRPSATYLKAMAWLMVLYYLGALGSALVVPEWEEGFWYSCYLAHAYLVGVFLNDAGVTTRVEKERFYKSLFSQPLFWLLFFCGGLALPGIAHSDRPNEVVSSVFLILAISGTGLFARGLHRRLKVKPALPVLYFSTTAVLCLLPFLFLFGDVEPGPFSPALVSPLVTVARLWDYSGRVTEFPYIALIVYGLMAVLGVHWGGHKRTP